MRFIVIDDFTNSHFEVEADTREDAIAEAAHRLGLDMCGSNVVLENGTYTAIQGAVQFVDEVTKQGWASEWAKQNGHHHPPKHQVVFLLVPV